LRFLGRSRLGGSVVDSNYKCGCEQGLRECGKREGSNSGTLLIRQNKHVDIKKLTGRKIVIVIVIIKITIIIIIMIIIITTTTTYRRLERVAQRAWVGQRAWDPPVSAVGCPQGQGQKRQQEQR
jgi:hypothetical protein